MWDQKTLQAYIDNATQEHLHLEYKAADALAKTDGKKDEITKDVSAMANSAGGTIIYGVKEYDAQDKRHLPEKIIPIDRVQFPKEWLEQIINGIQPRIVEIRIHPVDLGGNDVAYIVEIPQSTTAHQARDFRYYRRYNFEVLRMHDHEIRDVMHRQTLPNIVVEFDYVQSTIGNKPCYVLKVKVKNDGVIAIKHFMLQFSFPVYENERTRTDSTVNKEYHQGAYSIIVKKDGEYTDSYDSTFRSKDILFPKEEIDIAVLGHPYYLDHLAWQQIKTEKAKGIERPLTWIIYADDMPPKTGKLFLSELHHIE